MLSYPALDLGFERQTDPQSNVKLLFLGTALGIMHDEIYRYTDEGIALLGLDHSRHPTPVLSRLLSWRGKALLT